MAGNDTKSTLLCHWNGPDGAKEIVDDGNTGHIVTLVGTAQTSTAAKTVGNCSLLLDGDSDFITAPDSADWSFGTGDFTIDFWVKLNAIDVEHQFCGQYNDGSNYWIGWISDTQTIRLLFYSGGVIQGYYTSETISFDTTNWFHIALCRISTTCKIFVNGISKTLTETTAFGTNDVGDIDGVLRIGSQAGTIRFFNGYIDEFRISKGLARWTSNFTPSATPYVSDTASQLLLHMESHNIAIGGVYGPATFVGTAQLDTAVKTFGTASLLLDGDSDYVTFPDSADWDFSADFTVDCRINIPSFNYGTIIGNSDWYNGSDGWALFLYDTNRIGFNAMWSGSAWGFAELVNHSMSVNTWYHIAVVRSGTTIKIFKDGTELSSKANDPVTSITCASNPLMIGSNPTTPIYLNGYIDELRVSKGIARWNSNFTPPSAEYSEDVPAPGSTRRIFMIT